MQGVRKTICTGISGIAILAVISSCSSISLNITYNRHIFNGKSLLDEGQFVKARESFQRAADLNRNAVALTYLAISYYKADNLDDAARLILEAEKTGAFHYIHLRTLGYKALIFLKLDQAAGMDALKHYLDYYRKSDPLLTIDEVEKMWRSGKIDMIRLEDLIEEQVSWWERDVEQFYETGTGFYDRPPWPGGFFR